VKKIIDKIEDLIGDLFIRFILWIVGNISSETIYKFAMWVEEDREGLNREMEE